MTAQPVHLDLRNLQVLHPLLPATTARDLATRAAVALQRRDHEPGVQLGVALSSSTGLVSVELVWKVVPIGTRDLLDDRRITEDGAEAIALGVVRLVCRWIVRRRLQQGEHADWLLRDESGRLVALEVSGIDGQRDRARVAAKLRQVARCTVSPVRSACVVAFQPPFADVDTL